MANAFQTEQNGNAQPGITVFFSYAHEDEALRDKLAKHLKLMERTGVIQSWYDRQILPGQDWNGKIDEHLKTAEIILLLVSDDFLDSDYCWNVEVQEAMKRHEAKDACVIPVILREVDWTKAPFGTLQALPKNANAVTNWPNPDQAFTDIAKGIRKVAESWGALSSSKRSGNPSGTIPTVNVVSTNSSDPAISASPASSVSTSMDVLQKRLKLERLLSGLPGPQLSSVVTVLRPPAGTIPGSSAAQSERVSALMQWAEGQTGCGLDQLEQITQMIIANP